MMHTRSSLKSSVKRTIEDANYCIFMTKTPWEIVNLLCRGSHFYEFAPITAHRPSVRTCRLTLPECTPSSTESTHVHKQTGSGNASPVSIKELRVVEQEVEGNRSESLRAEGVAKVAKVREGAEMSSEKASGSVS